MARKPILCLDFDGVLHSYISGWKGAANIPDPPVDGAIRFLSFAIEDFDVQIFSSRSNQPGGIAAMKNWLFRYATLGFQSASIANDLVERLGFPTEKPPAMVTLDDRALTFTGVWPTIEELLAFEPWNKKPPTPCQYGSVNYVLELERRAATLEALINKRCDNCAHYGPAFNDHCRGSGCDDSPDDKYPGWEPATKRAA